MHRIRCKRVQNMANLEPVRICTLPCRAAKRDNTSEIDMKLYKQTYLLSSCCTGSVMWDMCKVGRTVHGGQSRREGVQRRATEGRLVLI